MNSDINKKPSKAVLEKRLEQAEEDMLKHLENEKNQKSKLTDEIDVLKKIKK